MHLQIDLTLHQAMARFFLSLFNVLANSSWSLSFASVTPFDVKIPPSVHLVSIRLDDKVAAEKSSPKQPNRRPNSDELYVQNRVGKNKSCLICFVLLVPCSDMFDEILFCN